MLKAIQELPDDATIEDAIERLYLLYKVERGIARPKPGKRFPKRKLVGEWQSGYVNLDRPWMTWM
jgi:hypothetical protein